MKLNRLKACANCLVLVLMCGCVSPTPIVGDDEHYVAYHLDDVDVIDFLYLSDEVGWRVPDDDLAYYLEFLFFELAQRDPYYVKPKAKLNPKKPKPSSGGQFIPPSITIRLDGSDRRRYYLRFSKTSPLFQIEDEGNDVFIFGIMQERQHAELIKNLQNGMLLPEEHEQLDGESE